jgi:hypothetical protein
MSKGDRFEDIKLLKEDKTNRVVLFDDMDLSSLSSDNHKFIEVSGFLTNRIIYEAKGFLNEEF